LQNRYGEAAVHPVLVAPEDRDGGIAGAPIFRNLATREQATDEKDSSRSQAVPILQEAAAEILPSPPALVRESVESSSQPETDSIMVPEPTGAGPTWLSAPEGDESARREANVSPEQRFRQVAYRFFRLPHSKKELIANKLGGRSGSGSTGDDLDRYKAVLAEVRANEAIDKLEKMIGRAEAE
jgi:hypothetical protein